MEEWKEYKLADVCSRLLESDFDKAVKALLDNKEDKENN